jgi:glycosyltransferase involved in cell wall biosynthesis
VYRDTVALRRCLQALAAQTYPKDGYEVIVVDNGSDDDVAAVTKLFDRASLLREPRPGSYAARNTGVAAASGELIAFTDADCLPEPNWIAAAVDVFEREPRVAMIGGRIRLVPGDRSRLSAADLYQLVMAFPQRQHLEQEHYALTANLFARRGVFRQVGEFDAALKSSGDREWSRRVYAAGFQQRYVEEASVDHPTRAALRDLLAQQRRIAGGTYQGGTAAGNGVLRLMGRCVARHARFAASNRGDPLLRTAADRGRFFAVVCLCVLARLFELAKLALGGAPRRR